LQEDKLRTAVEQLAAKGIAGSPLQTLVSL
jgi:hypothetical protein